MRKAFLYVVATVFAICLLAFSSSAMQIKDDYIAENGDYEIHWVYGDSTLVYSYDAPINIAKYEATYLATDGTTKEAVFYVNTSLYTGNQVFNKLYVPTDFDFSQLIVLPDVYVIEDGTSRRINTYAGSSGKASGVNFYTHGGYAGELAFSNETNANNSVTAFSYSKYTTYFAQDSFTNYNSLETVTYNGKPAETGVLFISATVESIAQGVFGAGNNNTANNVKVIYFENRGEKTLGVGKWCFARGIVERVVFESGNYNVATNDTIGYFYKSESDKTYTLKDVVICPGVKVNVSIGTMVGSYTTVFAGTQEQYQTEKNNLSSYAPTVFDVCYLTGHDMSYYEILYEDGFAAAGEKVFICQNDNCEHMDVVAVSPIFAALGYSVRKDGTALVGGYTINKDALAEYNTYTEENGMPTIKSGIVISNAKDFEIVNGKLTSEFGVLLEIDANNGYSRINYSIIDFKPESSLVNMDFVISLYTEIDGKMTLIQSSTKKSTVDASVNGDSLQVNTISLKTIVDLTIANLQAELELEVDLTAKEKIQATIDSLKKFSIE